MNIFVIASSVFFTIIVLGFAWGFFRGWCKSLIRLGVLVGDFIISLFVAPVISKAVVGNITSGSQISIFGLTIDFQSIVEGYFGSDLDSALGTTAALASSLMNVVINVVLFILMFILINIISLIVYGIVLLVLRKNREKDKVKKEHIGLKFLGGFEGLISSIVLLFVFLVPFFGIMDVLNNAVKEEPKPQATASAQSLSSSFMCGELYYTDDENIGEIEYYIESYASLKKKYNSSLMGFVFKYTGLNKLGCVSFNHLSTVKVDGEKIKLNNEIVTVINTYNIYKDTFINKDLDFTKAETIDSILTIYNEAKNSSFAKKYVEDLIPVLAEKWSNDETFLKISNPVPVEYRDLFNDFLKVFASSRNFNKIDENLNVIVNFIKVANEKEIISSIVNGQDIVDVLSSDNEIVKELIITLSASNEFKNNLPKAMNDALKLIYDLVVGDGNFTANTDESQNAVSNWETEAENLQQITTNILSIFNNLNDSNSENTDAIIGELGNIGKVIDVARKSEIVSESFKSFIIGFINSEKFDLGENTESLKTTLVTHINGKWSVEENPNFSFETTFKAVGETAKVATELLNSKEDIKIENLSSVLEVVVKNEDVKEVLTEIINDEIIKDVVGDNDTAVVLTDMLDTFIENTTAETIETDLEAAQAIIDVISSGDSVVLDQESSQEIIDNISKSSAIMSMIDEVSQNPDNTSLQNLVSNVSDENKLLLVESVSNSSTLTEDQKSSLFELFFGNV